MSLDPRKLNSLSKAGKYSSNANLIGITQKVFIKDSDAVALIASGDFTTSDVILSYNESTQQLKRYDHILSDWVDFGSGAGGSAVTSFNTIADLNAAATLPGGDSDSYKQKERLYLITDTMGLVAWDSDVDRFVSITGVSKTDFDSELNLMKNIDSDFRYRIRVNEYIKFVGDDSELPSVDGYYIFRTTRPDDSELRNAFIPYNGVDAVDSEQVKGAIFKRTLGVWQAISTYDDTDPYVTQDSVTFVKIGNQRWSSLLQSSSSFVHAVDTLADLTSTLKNESPGYVYVEEEQETYTWSANNDQTIRNGWRPFYPEVIETAAQYRALIPGQRFSVKRPITGINHKQQDSQRVLHKIDPTSPLTDNWSLTQANSSTRVSDTEANVTWTGKGGFDGATGDVVFNVTSTATENANFDINNLFNNTDCALKANARMLMESTGADAYVSGFYFRTRRGPYNEGFNTFRITIEHTDGTTQSYGSDVEGDTRVNVVVDNLDVPVKRIWFGMFHNYGNNPGISDFQMGFVNTTVAKSYDYIPTGTWIKTGTNDSDLAPAFPITISTGTRFIKTYTDTASMISSQVTDQHFEGGIYRVNTSESRIRYYEYKLAAGVTPTGTLADYNLVSASNNFTYNSVAALLADQANQTANNWYYVDGEMYHFKGTRNGILADYTVIGGTNFTDRDLFKEYKAQIFRPEDTFLYYKNLRDAETDGVLTSGTGRTLVNEWNQYAIIKANYYDVVVPANTAVMFLKSICDVRYGNYYARYLDGNEELLSGFGHSREGGTIHALPGPYGNVLSPDNAYHHTWVAVSVIKCDHPRTLRIHRNTTDDSYLSGLAFGRENKWAYNYMSSLEMNRRYYDQNGGGNQATSCGFHDSADAGGPLGIIESNTTDKFWVVASSKEDQLLFIHGRDLRSATHGEYRFGDIKINGVSLDSDLVQTVAEANSTQGRTDATRKFTGGWGVNHPLAMILEAEQDSSFLAVKVPGRMINIRTDSDGNPVPTPQLVQLTAGDGDDSYYRGFGFVKYDIGEYYYDVNRGGNYVPNNSTHWSGDPTSVSEALDRMAAAVYALRGNSAIP